MANALRSSVPSTSTASSSDNMHDDLRRPLLPLHNNDRQHHTNQLQQQQQQQQQQSIEQEVEVAGPPASEVEVEETLLDGNENVDEEVDDHYQQQQQQQHDELLLREEEVIVVETEEKDDDDGITIVIISKFLLYLLFTFISIGIVHTIVGQLFTDRDRKLKLRQLFLYEGDSITRDCFVFFVVGRIYKQKICCQNVCIWLLFVLVANIYFESQNYIWFLQHSVSMYEIYCRWPYQLWIFAIGIVVLFGSIFIGHIWIVYQRNKLLIKIIELGVCVLLFIVPLVVIHGPSNNGNGNNEIQYLHIHHWFAGWFLGMHFNLYDKWWSRAAMAYCYGMYINGIAVYGRDPLLTCDYANFIMTDLNCPLIYNNNNKNDDTDDSTSRLSSLFLEIMLLNSGKLVHAISALFIGSDMVNGVVDLDLTTSHWMNCSNNGYHP